MHRKAPPEVARNHSTALIRRFAAEESALVGALFDLFHEEMAAAARHLFRLYDLDQAVEDELGVVDEALTVLWRDARKGQIAWLVNPDDFLKVFHRALRSATAHSFASGRRVRRGGTAFQRREMDLDRIPSRSPDPSDEAAVVLDYETLVEHLEDPVLRNVAELERVSHSIRQIARKLGMSRSAVGRAFEQIRLTWKKIDCDTKRT